MQRYTEKAWKNITGRKKMELKQVWRLESSDILENERCFITGDELARDDAVQQ